MPRLIDTADLAALSLGEAVALLDEAGFDPRDEEAFAAQGAVLKRLSANRTFLADVAIAELKARGSDHAPGGGYGAQVVMLHRSHARYFVRANFWPAATDSVVRASGTAPFFYGVPHDHNFSFLTVGYLGPGYWSDYWEVDHSLIEGWAGEPVAMRFTGRHRLAEGQVMLYRAHRDVHSQLPADSLSVSLNIMEDVRANAWRDQYRFDTERSCVAGTLNRVGTDPLLALAALGGGDAGQELCGHVLARHPSDRTRLAALRALAGAAGSPEARSALWERGTRSTRAMVRETARRMLAV